MDAANNVATDFIMVTYNAPPPSPLYVDDDAPGDPAPNDPSISDPLEDGSPEHPYDMIQEAIYATYEGGDITVASGIYRESLYMPGYNIMLHSTDPASRSVAASTIISGGVHFNGTENETCVLSGFSIMHGYDGGIHGNGTYATIENNIITHNITPGSGGGIAYSNGTIQNNIIAGNEATSGGGGLAYCNGTIQENIISGNVSEASGGGLYSCNGSIRNNHITHNSANGDGGGIDNSNGTMDNNVVAYNTAIEGGGITNYQGLILYNTIYGNSAPIGGALYNSCIAWGEIANSIIWNNTTPAFDTTTSPTYSMFRIL